MDRMSRPVMLCLHHVGKLLASDPTSKQASGRFAPKKCHKRLIGPYPDSFTPPLSLFLWPLTLLCCCRRPPCAVWADSPAPADADEDRVSRDGKFSHGHMHGLFLNEARCMAIFNRPMQGGWLKAFDKKAEICSAAFS